MARVVYLHVGAPKTGTTYLQDRLAANSAALARAGVSYPTGLRGDMFLAAVDLLDTSWGGQRETARGEWDALTHRVRRASGTAVVSHEILGGADHDQVASAMRALGDAEVHLVYSARDLGRQIPAEWQERVKHQERRSFRSYLARVQRSYAGPGEDPSPNWFWRVQGLPEVLERWGRTLPPERVHVVTVPPHGAPRDELWRRYCVAFSIDPAWAPVDGARRNVSVGTAESTLVRHLNRRLKRAGLDSESYRRLVRQLVVHETLAARRRMTRVTLPPHAFPWAVSVAEEWVRYLEASSYDVVGDLADLVPVPPPEGRPWANPDKPRRREVNDAALDALVALVMEAARRPAARQDTPARVRRAVQRLRRR